MSSVTVKEDEDDAFGHEGFEVAEFSNLKDPFKLKEWNEGDLRCQGCGYDFEPKSKTGIKCDNCPYCNLPAGEKAPPEKSWDGTKWVAGGPQTNDTSNPFMSEMPHLDADIDVKGKHLGTLDLRIERYPISPEEKKGLFQAFSRTGVVGEYNGELLHFKPDYTVDVIDKEAAASVAHLPDDWEKYMMTVNEGNDGSIPDNDHLPDPKEDGEKYKKHAPSYAVQMDKDFTVNTIEGPAEAKEGDFLLKGEEGDMWPVDQEIFRKTYRPAETPKMEKVFKKK